MYSLAHVIPLNLKTLYPGFQILLFPSGRWEVFCGVVEFFKQQFFLPLHSLHLGLAGHLQLFHFAQPFRIPPTLFFSLLKKPLQVSRLCFQLLNLRQAKQFCIDFYSFIQFRASLQKGVGRRRKGMGPVSFSKSPNPWLDCLWPESSRDSSLPASRLKVGDFRSYKLKALHIPSSGPDADSIPTNG